MTSNPIYFSALFYYPNNKRQYQEFHSVITVCVSLEDVQAKNTYTVHIAYFDKKAVCKYFKQSQGVKEVQKFDPMIIIYRKNV